MQPPPDQGTPKRKYRSARRAGAAHSDASTALTEGGTSRTKRKLPQPEPKPQAQTQPETQAQAQGQPQPTAQGQPPPQGQAPQPKLVRSGPSSSVQRVDILLPRPPASPPPPPDKRPPNAARPPNAPQREEAGTSRQSEDAGAARRSRIQQEEKEFQLPKGFWSSLLIGVLCVAAVITLIVLARGWVGDFRQRQEGERRAEAEAVERANHPLYYRDLIERYAAVFDLDPALIAAVILCESSFDPDARSHVDARGLMQIMPKTAQWIADMTGEPDFNPERLFEAELNVRMGTWYLNYLAKLFDNDVRKMVCGYHAGQTNVAAWLRNPEYSSDGVTLDVIPTADTRGYEARVQRAIEVYRRNHFTENHFSEVQDGGLE